MKFTFVFTLLAVAASAQVPAIDWDKQNPELMQHYRALVQIDSTNPPGNETRVVEYLKKVFDAEGIPNQVFALEPARANMVARIKGNGSKRPILILAHSDTVGVQRDKWPVDPFAAVQKDGYVWGRGTSDDKDKLATNLMVMLLLKRSAARLDRDVIFLAESGEEAGTNVGIDYMVAEHFNEIDAEFALTEGGRTRLENGKVTAVQIATAEKVPRRVRIVVNGKSGHGSIPRTDNAVVHLSTAVGKLGAWQTPMRLNDTTRVYFERLATISSPEKAARYNGLLDPKRSAAIQRYLAENEPDHYSMLRTSVVPTIVKGGFQANVIPSEAEAIIDIRALPDEDMGKFNEEMARVIGDPAIKVEQINTGRRDPTPPSRIDTDMFRALESVSKKLYPSAKTMPSMLNAATDMAQLRAKGIQCYGIDPPTTDEDRINYGWHSDVERTMDSSLYTFLQFVWGAVTEVAVSK
jgi:acetylornithine deacetylase/succinyl-diaminopimelate desuccinylase-like protein